MSYLPSELIPQEGLGGYHINVARTLKDIFVSGCSGSRSWTFKHFKSQEWANISFLLTISLHKHEKKLQQSVILLQIDMVSPGTRLEKYHESLSRTNESQFKNNEFLRLYVTTQLIWRQTPKLCITVYWNKNISFYCQAQQKLKEIRVLKQQPQEQPLKSLKQDILQKHFTKTSSGQSINLCIPWDVYHKLFCIFGNFYEPGTEDAEVTKSLEN